MHASFVVRAAPRIDSRLLETIATVDDRGEPIAEICRRVGAAADRFGLTRPSYSQLRRLIREHRLREDEAAERRAILADAATRALLARPVDAYEVADRIRDVGRA